MSNLSILWPLFSQIVFLPSLSPPFWDIIHMLVQIMVSYISLKFCSFVFVLCTFHSSSWIISFGLFLNLYILNYVCSNLLEFFILCVIFFNSIISISFSYIISVFNNILFFSYLPLFLHVLLFFSSFNIFQIINWKSLSSKFKMLAF